MKYYFITIQAVGHSTQVHNLCIDKSPLIYIIETNNLETMQGGKREYVLLNSLEISNQDYWQYKDSF